MLIPLIAKDTEASDFTCRDGEIDFIRYHLPMAGEPAVGLRSSESDLLLPESGLCQLEPAGTYPTSTLRIPLQAGDKEKANLLLGGEISRVDPATAERLTQAIVQKAAECMLDYITDFRKRGLFILPFRFFTMVMTPDGDLSFPSPQAIALPADFPPHPEITGATATDDALTIAIRFPVRPHRLAITPSDGMPDGYFIRTFISYHLYVPDPKEMRGSIGSVRSATGGNATGIRFSFLSSSSIKASVAAPEKYYELVGNERTGYRLSSKATSVPDYSSYADKYGYVPPFTGSSLLALGDEVDAGTDPMDWIADWRRVGDGYLPTNLPYKFWSADSSGVGDASDKYVWLLTRPMALTSDSRSRRNAVPRAIRKMRIHGLDSTPCLAILFGSDDCRHWTPLRRVDPRVMSIVMAPPRLWWRLLLYGKQDFRHMQLALEIN